MEHFFLTKNVSQTLSLLFGQNMKNFLFTFSNSLAQVMNLVCPLHWAERFDFYSTMTLASLEKNLLFVKE